MPISELVEQAAEYFKDKTGKALPLPGLLLLQHTRPTKLEGTLYQPVVCLILQGRKEVTLGSRMVSCGSGESLIVSHDLPVLSQVTQASPEAPYLAMILTLALGILRSLYDQVAVADLETERAHSLDFHDTDADLIDVLGRYLALARKPVEAQVMAPLILREVHFRLLKDLRLMEARRLLSVDGHSVTNAAFEVGYESATQFSREYARKFGASPRNDLGTMR